MIEIVQIPGARCNIHHDGPAWDGVPTATIGGFAFDDAVAGAAVLKQAVERLRAAGAQAVLAPMDGDTWHAYRAVVETDGSSVFPMEPRSGPHDVAALEAAGFGVVSSYVSSRAPVVEGASDAHVVPGVVIRPWDGTGAEPLLERLFALAGSAFADKTFFKPIDREAFMALYRPMLSMVNPRMVLFAFDAEDSMVGFLFGFTDAANGSAVLKTYAATVPGVGRMLAERFHADAAELGHDDVVHALMHVDNVSARRSGQHDGRVFRRYALFGRRLAS